MLKIVIATALIFLAGGAWLSLDYLNKQEQAHAKEMHQGIVQARLEATKRVQTQANFESLIRANQSNCDAAAEKSQNEYMSIMQKAIPSKKEGPVRHPSRHIGRIRKDTGEYKSGMSAN